MYGRNALKTFIAWFQWAANTTIGSAWFKPPYRWIESLPLIILVYSHSHFLQTLLLPGAQVTQAHNGRSDLVFTLMRTFSETWHIRHKPLHNNRSWQRETWLCHAANGGVLYGNAAVLLEKLKKRITRRIVRMGHLCLEMYISSSLIRFTCNVSWHVVKQ